MANSGRSSPLIQLFNRSPSDSNTEDRNGSSSSTFMRSLSKCFDPPLDEAVVDEDGIAAKTKAGKGEFAKCRLCCVLPSSCGYGYDDLYSLAVIITSMLSSYYVSSCGSVLCFHYVVLIIMSSHIFVIFYFPRSSNTNSSTTMGAIEFNIGRRR